MKNLKLHLVGALVLVAGCGYPGEDMDQFGNPAPYVSEQQAAKQASLGIEQQAVGACGAWQADPDPSLPYNTSSYSNGAYEGTGNSCAGYGTWGYRYQCVELAQRYYNVRWGITPIWYANAKDMCTTHPAAVQTENLAGGANIWHGDLAVFGWGTYGHVAVINTHNDSNGSFVVVEQNTGSGGVKTYYRSQTICGLWTNLNKGPY